MLIGMTMTNILFVASGSYMHTVDNENRMFNEQYTHSALVTVFALDTTSSFFLTMYGGWTNAGLARTVMWVFFLLDIEICNRCLIPYVVLYGSVINVNTLKLVMLVYSIVIIVYSAHSHGKDGVEEDTQWDGKIDEHP